MAARYAREFDLHQLEIFCKIVELGSFSRAAEALYLTQPTLSSHIANLERAVTTRLLDRLGRSVVPTQPGKTLYEYALRVLEMRKEALDAIDAELGLVRGEITAGGSSIPGVYLLPSLIGQFTKKHPGIRVTLRLGDSSEILERVGSGEIDLAIVGQGPDGEAVAGRPFGRDQLSLVVPSAHPFAGRKKVSLADLRREPFIIREPGSGTRRFVESVLARHGILSLRDLNIVCELGSTEAVKEGIRAEMGISILSRRAVETEVQSGSLRFVDIDGVTFERKFHLVHHSQRTLSPITQAFLKFLHSLKI